MPVWVRLTIVLGFVQTSHDSPKRAYNQVLKQNPTSELTNNTKWYLGNVNTIQCGNAYKWFKLCGLLKKEIKINLASHKSRHF